MRGFLAALMLTAAASGANAQAWPSKPIRFIVAFPPGSTPDAIARTVSQHMQQTLGQPIIIDNKPGGLGAVGAVEAARSAPDGYTIFSGTNTTIAANPALFKKLPYDPAKDFIPVARLALASLILVVRPDFPAQNTKEFVALARAQPGKLTTGYASAAQRVSVAQLKALAGVDVLDVSYKSGPQAGSDVLGGQISFLFADFGVAVPLIRGGKVKAFGVTSATRATALPDIPALAEDIPGFEVVGWNGIVAPSGTPREAINRLSEAALKALAAPEVIERLRFLGFETGAMGPDELAAFIVKDTAEWARRVKAAGIEPE